MEGYNFNSLRQLVGGKVQLKDSQGNKTELTITEVNQGKLDGEKWEAFSVIYKGEKNHLLPQGTYTFLHPNFATQLLFLSPKSEIEYETVVTRQKTAAV